MLQPHGAGLPWSHDSGMLQPWHAPALQTWDALWPHGFGMLHPHGGTGEGSGVCRGDGVALSLSLHFVLLHVLSLPLAALEDEEAKVGEYRQLLAALPPVNRATLKALINHLFRYGINPLGIDLSTVGSWGALGCGGPLILWLMSPARKGEEFVVKLCLRSRIVSCMGVQGRGPGGALGQES